MVGGRQSRPGGLVPRHLTRKRRGSGSRADVIGPKAARLCRWHGIVSSFRSVTVPPRRVGVRIGAEEDRVRNGKSRQRAMVLQHRKKERGALEKPACVRGFDGVRLDRMGAGGKDRIHDRVFRERVRKHARLLRRVENHPKDGRMRNGAPRGRPARPFSCAPVVSAILENVPGSFHCRI